MTEPPALRSSDRILYETLQLFSRKGYDATSVREICEAATITKPTLYHLYGSKEGLYRGAIDADLVAHVRSYHEDEANGVQREYRPLRLAS